jgi:hypothetical protein
VDSVTLFGLGYAALIGTFVGSRVGQQQGALSTASALNYSNDNTYRRRLMFLSKDNMKELR